MSRNFFFQSFELDNYRGFDQFNIPDLRRITIIGGKNGTGKTALLEAFFMLLDRKNPAFLLRPFMLRNVPQAFSNQNSQISQVFSEGDLGKRILLRAKTKNGKETMELTFGEIPTPPVVNVPATNPGAIDVNDPALQQTAPGYRGLTVKVTIDHVLDELMYVFENATQPGMSASIKQAAGKEIPIATFLTSTQRHIIALEAARFTQVVQQSTFKKLLHLMQLAQPNLQNLQLLQIGNQSVICGDVGIGMQVPVSFLGEGVHLLMSVGLALLCSPSGVLLLDEFDSAIHYSILGKFWSSINILANELNCQIIAATHSRECIQAASDGLRASGAEKDLQYVRLDRTKGTVKATSYRTDELQSALAAEWEVR